MVRDLEYPGDARRTVDTLLAGLRYDAAIAVLGNAVQKLPLPDSRPDFSVPVRFGGRAEDEAVRREAPSLMSRLAVISMVSRLEVHAQNLLLQRRVLEHLGGTQRRMTPEAMWGILTRVQREAREGPVALCSRLVVEHPSSGLLERMKWLEGIYRVRNCVAHRLGRVQMTDVKKPGQSLEGVRDSDSLEISWLRLQMTGSQGEIVSFPHTTVGQENLKFCFAEEHRELRIGDQIEITPSDCQAIAMSLSLIGNHLLGDFEREMNTVLRLQ